MGEFINEQRLSIGEKKLKGLFKWDKYVFSTVSFNLLTLTTLTQDILDKKFIYSVGQVNQCPDTKSILTCVQKD